MLPAMIRSLSEDDVRRLTFPDVIKAIDAAFRDRYPHCVIPARVHIPTVDGVFLMMSCYDPAQNTLGMKLVTVRKNPQCPKDPVKQPTCCWIPSQPGLEQRFKPDILRICAHQLRLLSPPTI